MTARGEPVLRICIALALAVSAVGVASCGGGGEGSTSSAHTDAGSAKQADGTTTAPQGGTRHGGRQGGSETAQPSGHGKEKHSGEPSEGAPVDTSAHFTPKAHHDSGGGAAQFRVRGADNSIQEAGSEGSGAEFEEAAAALHAYLDARAAGAWSAACTYMSSGMRKSLEQLAAGAGSAGQGGANGSPPDCPAILAGLSAGLPPAALREAAQADVGSLRVEGESGFVLFHGAQHVDYFMPMAREGGSWKVAALAPSAFS